ncbi:MAG: hypothetical protein IPQ16_15090 [Geobacteraceae bacterium]|nr:hypothetical protein [Geobacteraceae bacterium]
MLQDAKFRKLTVWKFSPAMVPVYAVTRRPSRVINAVPSDGLPRTAPEGFNPDAVLSSCAESWTSLKRMPAVGR